MNTAIKEAISRKRKTEIRMPISLNTHLISKRTNRYINPIANTDHTAILTFVSSHTHVTTHTNLNTNFMLIPEVRLLCFVLSFLFSMTFFSAASVRSAVFVSYWQHKVGEGDTDKFFALNTLAQRERGRFNTKPDRGKFFVSPLRDTFANRKKK
jgi:hypothetical protein